MIRFDRILRIALGAVFVVYAFAKFSGSQFSHFELDGKVSDVDPVTLVWYFFGYSKLYAMFIATGELVAGLAVLFRRTYRLGLLIYMSIATNVAVLDWAFDLPRPATLLATSLAVACGYLIFRERAAYARLTERRRLDAGDV